ncbi:hypothetical protein ACFL0Y_01065 [Patescibacteria group bacterium]
MPEINKTAKSTLKSRDNVQVVRPEALKILLDWTSPERLFKKRSREYFTTIGAMAFFLIVILLLSEEWILVVVIIALAFFAFIMATIEPREAHHQITNRGIITGGRQYQWGDLGRFWFEVKFDQKVLYVENRISLPYRLIMILGDISDKKVQETLSQFLLFEEPEKTWADNASSWLSKRVPLEKH